MTQTVHYEKCPVCNSANINPLLTVKDHSVSGESFVIWQCSQCTVRFTQDAPNEAAIGQYYKSENYISHTNTARGFVNKAYLKVRTFTLKLKNDVLQKYTGLQTGNLLDVGAGTGAFVHFMQQSGWATTGLEPDEQARTVAQQQFGLSLQPHEVLKKLPAQQFDAITLWHVLEHVHELHSYMDILKSLLKPQGKIFIAVPNYKATDASIYRSSWAAYDVPRHLYHFSPQAINKLALLHGFKVIGQEPMWFDAFYISLLSSKYKKGSTSWLGAFASGVRSNVNAFLHKERCSSLIYVLSL
ncbi:MAG TPA: class I SAM-dependent methyltransferase [Niastella sp.]|nr:class I SAM-dependent methyltransferase [Niastella sp.]